MRTTITAIASVKNIIAGGYPAVEAFLSVYPIADEMLINDGGSEDGTAEVLEKLRSTFPGKIHLFNFPWSGKDCGRAFDASLNELIGLASGSWIFEMQGDEFWHERDIPDILLLIDRLHNSGKNINSIRHRCQDTSWTSKGSYPYMHVRIVRKIPGLVSNEWGDCFHIRGESSVRAGYTSHNVPSEFVMTQRMWHMHRLFPANRKNADYAMALYNSAGDPPRADIWEKVKTMDFSKSLPPNPGDVLPDIPKIIAGMSQETEYRIRPELFDREWLEKTTGLPYE
jgi:hypothetical protein